MNKVHDDGHHNNKSFTFGNTTYTGVPCVICHIAIPHGSKRSRLIAYSSDVIPYAAVQADGTKMPVLQGFRKASAPGQYGEKNCWSSAKACDEHKSYTPPYDP